MSVNSLSNVQVFIPVLYKEVHFESTTLLCAKFYGDFILHMLKQVKQEIILYG